MSSADPDTGPVVGAEARAERDRETETLLKMEPGTLQKSRETGKSHRELDTVRVVSQVVRRVYLEARAANGTDTAEIEYETQLALDQVLPVVERANPYHSDPKLRTYPQEDFDAWDEENSRLRELLLWLATRPGVTLEERRQLRDRLSGAVGDKPVATDPDETAHQDFLDVRKSMEELIRMVEAVRTTDIPENTQTTSGNRRMLPIYWHSHAEEVLNRARGRLEEFPEITTLARLRQPT